MKANIHRILFVDDDVMVLKGFRRSVDEYSDTWEADFVASGQEALAKLAQHPFDAVVADMHMPGMDGIELLTAVSRQTPEVMRFVLSGNTSDAQILKSTRLVHQMIPKPSDMEKIFGIVERACRLRDRLSDPHLLRVITGIKTLPSVPQLYTRLVKELQSEDPRAQVVGEIIAQDTAMTAKILQLVNSAFFGLSDNVSSPQRAVTLLGLNTIKALVLGIQVFSEFQGRTGLPISVDTIWKHSLQVSAMGAAIAKAIGMSPSEREDVRVAGMLHDIGILLYFKIPYLTPRSLFTRNVLVDTDQEYQVLGTSHAEMGGYLLGIWGLPATIVEAVAFHHAPWMQVSNSTSIVDVLYTANGLLNLAMSEKDTPYSACLDVDYLRQTGLGERLDEWLGLARDLANRS